ncbi:DUF481 domain-containing protein [Kineobactrum sediminis]|uniref:DUF481 domain-containing protein n=1 Tax=Kineobactrum sediminis TaxID=1905677 RepID=A0A2N5Y5F4_9GAMM|nr:DUF481 domain-containing protein [Kineobactrum sediminis]PLW83591.1 DUF481 domain-containing protein [Kineobactrum sediminis]
MTLYKHRTVPVLAAPLLLMGALIAQADTAATQADEIVLKNGSRLLGTITGVRDGMVKIDTEFAGSISIKLEHIDSMEAHDPVVLLLENGTVVESQGIAVEQQELVLSTPEAPASRYPLQDLALTDPAPWELGQGYNWTGLASAALSLQRGNTDSDEFDYKLDASWRSTEDRYTALLSGEVDEANGVRNAENWSILGKYDRFLDGPLYWGINASVEQDEFADVDLRYYLGPYLGREFYSKPVLNLSGEAGLVLVDEDFIIAEDEQYLGANWTVNASSNYLGGDSRLYLRHTGIWNLDETDEFILHLAMGLGFPLLAQIEAAAEILLDYDSGLPAEVDSLDQAYRFRIGYSW